MYPPFGRSKYRISNSFMRLTYYTRHMKTKTQTVEISRAQNNRYIIKIWYFRRNQKILIVMDWKLEFLYYIWDISLRWNVNRIVFLSLMSCYNIFNLGIFPINVHIPKSHYIPGQWIQTCGWLTNRTQQVHQTSIRERYYLANLIW